MIERKIKEFEVLGQEDVGKIHQISLEILEKQGVEFHHGEARTILGERGFKVDGKRVYFPPKLVEEQLALAPAEFKLHARNPENSVMIGGRNTVLAPGYGAPFVMDFTQGKRRSSTYEDYINFTRLAGHSTNMDVVGGVLVEPGDIPDRVRHGKMFLASVQNTDKCLMGSALGSLKARECLEMAAILFGSNEFVYNNPVLISLINTNSPLQFDGRMLEALMVYAASNQPTIISSLSMTGTTAPATLAAALVQQNVEIVAGITLSQLINPGTPVIYGSASSVVDLKTGNLAIGSPETVKMFAGNAQMARFYGIPSRGGGALTDALLPNAQSGYEAMMVLYSTVNSGFHFILHSAGLLENYMTMSFEKFVMDDEMCGMIKDCFSGIKMDDENLGKDVIMDVGSGGQYISQDHTYRHMKELRIPIISPRERYLGDDQEIEDIMDRASRYYKKVLAEYEGPELDRGIEKDLSRYIEGME